MKFGAGLVFVWLTAACGEPSNRCVDRGDCGVLQICADRSCQTVDCVTSTDCGIGSTCNPDGYVCDIGCGADADCLAGERCDARGLCATYGCRDTVLDCAIGERCDLARGICAPASTCASCTGPESAECGAGACVDFVPDTVDGQYCLMPCTAVDQPEQCPRGLACQDLSGAGDLYCYAWCPAIREEMAVGAP